MTRQKSFKRLVRARMDKTGESYTRPRSARFDWEAGETRVHVTFAGKGEATATAVVSHERLADAAEAERMKAYWRGRVATLKEVLEG